MKVVFDPDFYKRYKKVDVRIQIRVDERIRIFRTDPFNPELNNHLLKEPYLGNRSIDITTDYRAIYKEKQVGKQIVAYFIALDTHKNLYSQQSN